jgi:alginate O-acetyltransferase complex protein AlgI
VIFTTFSYFLFLIPTALLFRAAGPRLRPWTCVVSGIAFFVYFSVTELAGWIGAACVVIFLWEALISRFYARGSRWCGFGAAASVAVLVAFKYRNFFTGLLTLPFGVNRWEWRHAFLPLGISFFTFEFIHYAVDRYKGRVERGTAAEYLAFIFFFPTLVAGPIKRFQSFVVNLRDPSRDWPLDWNRGVTRVLVGLVKKFAVADLLSSFTVHLNAADIARATRPMLLLWLLAYGGKIYFDFSAYSDIAIGSGRLFGLNIPENFDWPYARTNIAEFWSRWHRSLTGWLIDYIFIPLGGSRVPRPRVYGNIMMTMLVSGLWHGAGLNFLVWGAWHGTLLVIHRLWTEWRRTPRRGAPEAPTAAGEVAAWAMTFASVTLGWAFFAMDLPTAAFYFRCLILG